MFEQYTEASKAVLVEAQDLAVELGSGYISVGHLLYGCAEVRAETAGRPLRDCGITAAYVRRLLPHTPEQPARPIPKRSAPSGSTTAASGQPSRQPSDPGH